MKKILGLVLSLTVISGVCAAVLAYVDSITKDPIVRMRVQQEQSAVQAVLPPGATEIVEGTGFFVGMNEKNDIVGYAAKGKDGCVRQGWLISYDWDTGEEVERIQVSQDTYSPGTSIYFVGVHERTDDMAPSTQGGGF